MKRTRLAGGVGAAVFAAAALADVTDINSVVIQERRFNDYPDSSLVTVDNFPALVSFTEQDFGAGGFANQHVARFSPDDTNPYVFQNSEPFDIKFDIMLDAGSVSPRKEAGFRLDTFIAGEGFFIATSDGEVAAFGGPLPFHSFGGNAYVPGTVAEMRMIYTPDDDPDPNDGDAATMEYIFDGMSSGKLNFGNLENGMIDGSDMGVYVQNQPDDNNPGDFSVAEYRDFMIAVPEPASLLLLLGGVAAALRRR